MNHKSAILVLGIVLTILAPVMGQTRLACVGNSITAGTSGPSYVPTLSTLLGSNYSVQNDGLGGTTLLRRGDYSYWTTSQFHSVFNFKPNIITIKLGTNDSKSQNWSTHSTEFAGDLNALIDTFQTIIPKPQIWLVLCAPSWSNGYGINGTVINNEIVPIIRSVATARGLPLIDCNTPLLSSPGMFSDGVHPNASGADSVARIFYHTLIAKPIMRLSDTLVTAQYYTGQAKTVQASNMTVVNALPGTPTLTAPVTITKKRAWLTVTVNAAKPDSQVITNTIDPASLPDVEQKYYDTVTVHAANALVPDRSYQVLVWIRQSPVLTSLSVTPAAGSLPSAKPFRFSAVALDQYGQPMVSQPAIGWTATGGSVDATGLFTPQASAGTARIIAAATGNAAIKDTADVTLVSCAAGLAYDYYGATLLASVNDIASRTPTRSGVVQNISISPTATSSDSFALRFTGYVLIPAAGVYSFYTSSDDGSVLLIDGAKVVDNDGVHADQERSGDITLGAGLHTLSVLFFEAAGGQSLTVRWQTPGQQKTALPDSVLLYGTAGTSIGANAPNHGLSQSNEPTIAASSSNQTMTLGAMDAGTSWKLELFKLNGIRIAQLQGRGPATIPLTGIRIPNGGVIARLQNSTGARTIERLMHAAN